MYSKFHFSKQAPADFPTNYVVIPDISANIYGKEICTISQVKVRSITISDSRTVLNNNDNNYENKTLTSGASVSVAVSLSRDGWLVEMNCRRC